MNLLLGSQFVLGRLCNFNFFRCSPLVTLDLGQKLSRGLLASRAIRVLLPLLFGLHCLKPLLLVSLGPLGEVPLLLVLEDQNLLVLQEQVPDVFSLFRVVTQDLDVLAFPELEGLIIYFVIPEIRLNGHGVGFQIKVLLHVLLAEVDVDDHAKQVRHIRMLGLVFFEVGVARPGLVVIIDLGNFLSVVDGVTVFVVFGDDCTVIIGVMRSNWNKARFVEHLSMVLLPIADIGEVVEPGFVEVFLLEVNLMVFNVFSVNIFILDSSNFFFGLLPVLVTSLAGQLLLLNHDLSVVLLLRVNKSKLLLEMLRNLLPGVPLDCATLLSRGDEQQGDGD